MPKYVVLHHQLSDSARLGRAAQSHFDWMFEHEDVLWTWAMATLPEQDEVSELIAERLPNHRKAYLTYEGVVSGNRGSVTRIECGEYELLPANHDGFRFQLSGNRTALLELQRIRSSGNLAADVDRWYASFRPTRVDAS